MTDAPLVLHAEAYWHSPWDCACWVAMREKGLTFARSLALIPGSAQMLGPGRRQGASEASRDVIRTRMPAARVPALQHGDFWLAESVAIVEYLEDVFPRRAGRRSCRVTRATAPAAGSSRWSRAPTFAPCGPSGRRG